MIWKDKILCYLYGVIVEFFFKVDFSWLRCFRFCYWFVSQYVCIVLYIPHTFSRHSLLSLTTLPRWASTSAASFIIKATTLFLFCALFSSIWQPHVFCLHHNKYRHSHSLICTSSFPLYFSIFKLLHFITLAFIATL